MFKIISYPKMLFDTLSAYFSVNDSGYLTIMYKYCFAILFVLQTPFNSYDNFRIAANKLASCTYTIGQLANQLNYLYDSTLRRITITQAKIAVVFAPRISDAESTVFAPRISDAESTVFAPRISDTVYLEQASFNVPSSLLSVQSIHDSIVATIESVKLDGLTYKITSI